MTVISHDGRATQGRLAWLRRFRAATYGGGLGVLVIAVGLLLIGIGWNGMAGGGGEINGVPNLNAQLPWLVSGGLLGLAFVVFGSAILVANNARVDRARLEAKLDDLTAALERSTAATQASVVKTFTPEPREPREPRVVKTTAVAKKAPAKRATASPRR
jgi:hypothetical protein